MRLLVAVTDRDWFDYLRAQPDLGEANFWQPSGSRRLRALSRGEPLLFKLHAPDNFIVGGGFLTDFQRLPHRTAWEFFGEANGAPSLAEMRRRIAKYRRVDDDPRADFEIGCIMLTETFFFDDSAWIPVPRDWAPNIVQYKGYDTAEPIGRELWQAVLHRLQALELRDAGGQEQPSLYSDPVLSRRRLGQGGFRALVSSTYQWRCAVTAEKAHPVLEAAHIRPVSEGGRHEVPNGLLLRSDVHRLFDNGYVTITPDHRFRVSRRLKDDFDNGEPYFPYDGSQIWIPKAADAKPSREFLEWHADTVFRP